MGLKVKIIIAAILFTVISTGFMYIKALRAELEAAAEVQIRMEGVINQQKLVLDRQEQDMKKMQEVNREVSAKVANAQQEVADLNRKFASRDLSAIASAKPTETEEKVNRGTKDALRCNEIVTGSPLTADEKSGKIRNSICNVFIKDLIEKEKSNAQ